MGPFAHGVAALDAEASLRPWLKNADECWAQRRSCLGRNFKAATGSLRQDSSAGDASGTPELGKGTRGTGFEPAIPCA